MTSRRAFGVFGAASAVGAYWALNFLLGPFDAARRYGRVPGVGDFAFMMSAGEWRWYACCLAVTIATICLFVAFRKSPGRNPEPGTRNPLLLAPVTTAVLLALAIRVFILHGAPTCDDEMVYRFQAQTLAAGHWTAPAPPDPKAFEHIFLGIYRGRWFGQYGFGHPLILALGEIIGAIGLIGPLLAGLLTFAVFLLARRLFDERVARLAAWLAALSPLFAGTGATLLSQNSATPLVLLGVFFALVAADTGRFRHALAATLLLGAAFWCRNQEPVLLGLGPLLLLAWRIARGPARWPLLSGALLGGALAVIPLLLLQWHLWGHPLWSNYQAYWWGYLHTPLRSPFGFGEAPWDIVHTPQAALAALARNLVRLDAFLLGAPLAVAAAIIGLIGARRTAAVWAAFAGFPLTVVVLFFYFWPGLADTGPQLYHAAGALLLPFIAAGVLHLTDRKAYGSIIAALLALAIPAALTFWPTQLLALRRVGLASDEIPRLVHKAGLQRAVVFTDLRPWRGGFDRCWVLGRPMPRPDLSDPVIYLVTWGKPVDLPLAARLYPDRPVYYLKQIDGRVALLPADAYQGIDSLRAHSAPRDLPP